MRASIHIIFGCYERVVRAERTSALQGSGLVRTVGPCAQRRVALMPRTIATTRDALWNDQQEVSEQVLAIATGPRVKQRRGLFSVIPSIVR